VYNIREGQIWKSNVSWIGDIKILKVFEKSSLGHVMVLDINKGTTRVFNGYNIARTGHFTLMSKSKTHSKSVENSWE
jgi:hypothetical protein